MQSELAKAARDFMFLFIVDGGDRGISLDDIDPMEFPQKFSALEAALSAAEPKPMPSVAVENLITEVHDAIDEYREGMKGDKFGPHEWPTVDGIKTTVAQALRRSALSAQVQDVAAPEGWQLVPVMMTAAMVNAWSGGKTVSTDENAYHTTFQDAWARVLAAAPAKQEGGHD